MTGDFWRQLAQLVAESEIVIDRPQGSAHPRYPDFVYPLDYGGGLHSGFGEAGCGGEGAAGMHGS